jgi:hypothetical protein
MTNYWACIVANYSKYNKILQTISDYRKITEFLYIQKSRTSVKYRKYFKIFQYIQNPVNVIHRFKCLLYHCTILYCLHYCVTPPTGHAEWGSNTLFSLYMKQGIFCKNIDLQQKASYNHIFFFHLTSWAWVIDVIPLPKGNTYIHDDIISLQLMSTISLQ